MIEIQKTQNNLVDIDLSILKAAIEATLGRLDQSDVDVTLRLTDDQEMRELNHRYRGIDQTTDVLSFYEGFTDPETGRLYLGDIVISVDKVQQQAPENHHTTEVECAFLAIHGTLHLLGFDHDEPERKADMWDLQEKLFADLLINFKEKPE